MYNPNLAVIGVTFDTGDGPSAAASAGDAALDADAVMRMRAVLARIAPDRAHVVLSTCCRTEIVIEGIEPGGAADGCGPRRLWDQAWSELGRRPAPPVITTGAAAEQYLFELACGLRSPLLGDTELLGQVRRAWRDAADGGLTSTSLDRLFRHALEVGARARLDTDIAAGGAGVAGAVLTLMTADDPADGDRRRRVLVVGAGSAGRAVARRLGKHRIGPITVANRTPAAAERLAGEIGGVALPIDRIGEVLHHNDVVISAVPAPVLTRSVLQRAFDVSPGWRPVLIDVAGPSPSIDPVDGLTVVRLDDLQTRRDAVARRREQAIPAVDRLIGHQLALHRRTADPVVASDEDQHEHRHEHRYPSRAPSPVMHEPHLGELSCVS